MADQMVSTTDPDAPWMVNERRVTWADVFNADRSRFYAQDLKTCAAEAKAAGFEYLVHRDHLYFVADNGDAVAVTTASAAGGAAPAAGLTLGIRVRRFADGSVLAWETQTELFVVAEMGWEYNDEFSFPMADSAGWPRAVFSTRAAAEASATERSVAAIANMDDVFERMSSGGNEYLTFDECIRFADEDVWRDWLDDHDIPKPVSLDADVDGWLSASRLQDWWDDLPREARAKVAPLVKLDLFDVYAVDCAL